MKSRTTSTLADQLHPCRKNLSFANYIAVETILCLTILDIPQALSISRSLYKAKSAVENGEVNCTELRKWVIQAIQDAGGKVDYAEVRAKF